MRAAVQEIWNKSPEVQAAAAELEAARARARAAARPLYNPSLTADAENADVNRRTVGISLPLDLSGKRRAREAVGDADLRAGEAAYALQRIEVASRWLKAWSEVALTVRQRELGQRRVEMMRRFDELAAQRLKVGDISSPERDLAALALSEALAQQAALTGKEAAARATLQAIAGAAAEASPALPEGLPPQADGIVALPIDELPALHLARARQASAQAGVRVAQKARIPDPTLSLTGGEVRVGAIRDNVIGLSVSIPLPVLNNGSAEVDAARADADAAAANAQAQRLRLRSGLEEARTRYTALRSADAAFHSGRAAAFADRTALLEKLWRAGEISTSDYLVQLKESLNTALTGLELQSQTWQTWFDYLTAAGRLNDWIEGRTQDLPR
ncbi:MAG: transporter [Lysobacterales bacterium 66-474]|nr:MAG: transporter [Rhodanobacter sp. SCN 69-32]OJY84236.1 MAG: transporter [Xanthomonadales bacterium 66-474]